MIAAYEESWLTRARNARRLTQETRALEREHMRRTNYKKPWPAFRREVFHYFDFFSEIFPETALLAKRITDEKNAGKKILCVDFFGAAHAGSLGVPSIALTLDSYRKEEDSQESAFNAPLIEKGPLQKIIYGDAFTPHTASQVETAIKESNAEKVYSFWFPVGGNLGFGSKSYESARLYALFEKTFNAMPSGSVLYANVTHLASLQAVLPILHSASGITVSIEHAENNSLLDTVYAKFEKHTEGKCIPSWKDVVRNEKVQKHFNRILLRNALRRWVTP